MKTTNPLAIAAVWTSVLTILAFAPATCPAENLYSASVTAKLNFQSSHTERVNCHRVDGQRVCDEVEVPTIRSIAINNRALINLVLGQSPFSVPPTNLTFAVSFGCDDDDRAKLVVFDRGASNVVAIVGDLSDFDLLTAGKVMCAGNGPCDVVDTSYEGFMKLSLRTLGDLGVNSINGGEIRLYVKGSLSSEGCIIKAIGSGSGKINVTVDGDHIDVFVSNFGLVTGRKLGQLPEPVITTSTGSEDTIITPVSSTTLGGYVDSSVSASMMILQPTSSDALIRRLPDVDRERILQLIQTRPEKAP